MKLETNLINIKTDWGLSIIEQCNEYLDHVFTYYITVRLTHTFEEV